MASTFAPGEVRRTPTADDRAGRNAIYGIVGGSDFDGDGTSDLVVWRPSDGVWYVAHLLQWLFLFSSPSGGASKGGGIPVGGSDFDGDGTSDLVVWRPSDGVWYVAHLLQWLFLFSSPSGGAWEGTSLWGTLISMVTGPLTWWSGGLVTGSGTWPTSSSGFSSFPHLRVGHRRRHPCGGLRCAGL